MEQSEKDEKYVNHEIRNQSKCELNKTEGDLYNKNPVDTSTNNHSNKNTIEVKNEDRQPIDCAIKENSLTECNTNQSQAKKDQSSSNPEKTTIVGDTIKKFATETDIVNPQTLLVQALEVQTSNSSATNEVDAKKPYIEVREDQKTKNDQIKTVHSIHEATYSTDANSSKEEYIERHDEKIHRNLLNENHYSQTSNEQSALEATKKATNLCNDIKALLNQDHKTKSEFGISDQTADVEQTTTPNNVIATSTPGCEAEVKHILAKCNIKEVNIMRTMQALGLDYRKDAETYKNYCERFCTRLAHWEDGPIEQVREDDNENSCKILYMELPEGCGQNDVKALLHIKTTYNPQARFVKIAILNPGKSNQPVKCLLRFLTSNECLQVYNELQDVKMFGRSLCLKLDVGYKIAEHTTLIGPLAALDIKLYTLQIDKKQYNLLKREYCLQEFAKKMDGVPANGQTNDNVADKIKSEMFVFNSIDSKEKSISRATDMDINQSIHETANLTDIKSIKEGFIRAEKENHPSLPESNKQSYLEATNRVIEGCNDSKTQLNQDYTMENESSISAQAADLNAIKQENVITDIESTKTLDENIHPNLLNCNEDNHSQIYNKQNSFEAKKNAADACNDSKAQLNEDRTMEIESSISVQTSDLNTKLETDKVSDSDTPETVSKVRRKRSRTRIPPVRDKHIRQVMEGLGVDHIKEDITIQKYRSELSKWWTNPLNVGPKKQMKENGDENSCKILYMELPENWGQCHVKALLYIKTKGDERDRYNAKIYYLNPYGVGYSKFLLRFYTHKDCLEVYNKLQDVQLFGRSLCLKLDIGYRIAKNFGLMQDMFSDSNANDNVARTNNVDTLNSEEIKIDSNPIQTDDIDMTQHEGASQNDNGIEINRIDESDENRCRIVEISNLPKKKIDFTFMSRLLKIHSTYGNATWDHRVIDDDSTALVLCASHIKAVQLVKELNGAVIDGCKLIVKLDIGHKTTRLLPLHCLFNNKRKLVVPQTEEVDPTKKIKYNEPTVQPFSESTRFFSPRDRKRLIYGLSPEFLQNHSIGPILRDTVDVFNLQEEVNETNLHEIFSLAGFIRNLKFEKSSPFSKATIVYDHPTEAVQAISMFDKQTVFNTEITVKMNLDQITLPRGLQTIGKGLGKNGKPIMGLRNHCEQLCIQKTLANMGQLQEVPLTDEGFSFKFVQPKCAAQNQSDKLNQINYTKKTATASIENLPGSSQNTSKQIDGSAVALGAILAIRGLIDKNPQYQDVDSILNALRNDGYNVINESPIAANENLAASFRNTSRRINGSDVALGAILSTRGLIDKNSRSQDVDSILNALRSNGHDQDSRINHASSGNAGINPSKKQNLANNKKPNLVPNVLQIGRGGTNVVPNASVMTSNFANAPIRQHCSANALNMGQNFKHIYPIASNINQPLPNTWQESLSAPILNQPPQMTPHVSQALNLVPLMQICTKFDIPSKQNTQQDFNRKVQEKQSFNQDLQHQQLTTIGASSNYQDRYDEHSQDRIENSRVLVDQRIEEPKSTLLILKNLPPSVTVRALNSKMCEIGEVTLCEVTGLGGAVVRFKHIKDAVRCIRLFHRSKVDGQVIDVAFV